MKIITARPHRLLQEVIKRIGELVQREERCMMIVPSQYTLQAEIEVMTQLNLEGTFMIDVLSPGRLQGRVFERAGYPAQTIFDESGKCMILTEAIEQEKENLTVYRASAEQGAQGLAQKMSSLIADFKRGGKTAQEILCTLEQMEDTHSPAISKLRDAARIFSAYEERIKGILCDTEDVSREFLDRVARSGVLDGQHVFIYGFDMITPQFGGQIVQMAPLCRSLTLAVEADGNSAPDGRLFAPVNFSIERLKKLAQESGVTCGTETIVQELDAPEEIQILESGLFALGSRSYERIPQSIELHAVSSVRQEVHKAASRIRSMLAEGEESGSMAVVYPAGSGYGAIIPGVFAQYGVGAYVAEKRPAGAHPLCRFISSALAVVSGGWRTHDVVECMQTGFLPLEQRERDMLCTYMEGVEIRSEAVKRPFTYIKNGDEQALEALNSSRERICTPLKAFAGRIKAAETADETIEAVLTLLEDVHAFETLSDMRAALEAAGLNSEAEDCAQVWNRLMETLDQMHMLLGEKGASAKMVLQLLDSGLAALELAALPPADGAVVCGEIGNVRTARVNTLFALGMNDTAGSGAGGLFTPQEQEEAERAAGVYLGMSRTERAALTQLDELKALTAPRCRLIISYALSDETGRALREAMAVQNIRRLFPNLPVCGGILSKEREDMLCAPDAALEALSVQLSSASDGGEEMTKPFCQAYAALARSEEGAEKLRRVTQMLGSRPRAQLDAARARALYGRPVMSVSRLETYAQCPYRHFVAYGLAPQKNAEPGIDRAELGTLYHEAAEQFTRSITAMDGFPQIDEKTCDEVMDRVLTPLIDQWRQSPLGASRRGAAIARRIERTARRAGRSIAGQFAGGRFKPMSFEMVFGKRGAAPIMLELGDGSFVYLQGRIDRIDVLDEGKKKIRIVDYKSGTKQFDPTMVYFGIQLQLLLYLAAALNEFPGAQPAGFFYCRIADPTIKSESRVKEEIERQIAKKLSLAGISLSDVEVLQAQSSEHAAMVTRDGKPSGRYQGMMTDQEGMDAMIAFARRKAAQLAGETYNGRIEASPAAYGQYSACTHCDYAAVCGFDPATSKRRYLEKKSAQDLCDANQ